MHLSLSLSNYLLISIFIHVYNMVISVFLSFFPFSFNTSENFNVDLSFFLSKRIKYNIQTQLAHIANGQMVKNRVLFCNNSKMLDTILRHFMTSSFPSIMSLL